MSYIGNPIVTQAFVTDQFNGNGSTTAFTMSVAPANTASILVAVSGVVQDPSTYSVNGLTLTFSAAPPTGTGNISVRYLGIPASGVTTTAYRTVTEFTATAGQTTFTPPSYTVGFINVYRNGVRLGAADYTATNGTTVVLASGATAGDLVSVESFLVSSVLNAIPATAGSVSLSGPYISGVLPHANLPTGSVLQVVSTGIYTNNFSTTNSSFVASNLTATITPKSATSKILIFPTATFLATGGTECSTALYRNAVNLTSANQFIDGAYVNGGYSTNTKVIYDNPATTSPVTYTIYVAATAGGTAYVYRAQCMTLMEIAG